MYLPLSYIPCQNIYILYALPKFLYLALPVKISIYENN